MSHISNSLIMSDLADIWSWVQSFRQAASSDLLEIFIGSCWCLWTNINRKVHEDTVYDAQESIQFIRRHITTFKAARTEYNSPRSPCPHVMWFPSAAGTTKVNYDAYVQTSIKGAGVGVVARISDGVVLA